MTEQTLEQLSALMDGELEHNAARFLLRRFDADTKLPQHWSRYHVTRACLRRQLNGAVMVDLAEAVMQCIENETISMPSRSATPWMRWVSGGAIAAAVAMAALLLPRPAGHPEPALSGATANLDSGRVAEPNLESRITPLLAQPPIATTASFDYSRPAAVYDPRFESYLIRHYEASGAVARSGLAPYVLLVEPTRQAPANTFQDKSANPP